jgi:RNA polymerase sigma-70 factor (ECF subfamily)
MEQAREARLLELARAGDSRAVDELFKLYRPHVKRVLAFSAPGNDVDDLVQQTLVAGAASLPGYQGSSSGRTWLSGIARNVLRNHFRSGSRTAKAISLDALESDTGVQRPADIVPLDQQAAANSTTTLLLVAMRKVCNAAEQNILNLSYRGEPLNEIGGLLDMPAATVRSHFRRGRCKLLSHLIDAHSEILGGAEAILAAWRKSCSDTNVAEHPTIDEREAWENRKPGARAWCGAVLKLARYLTIAG